MSGSLSFSKRTVAIALAASVVASGAQVVAPSFEVPFGAAVAQAQVTQDGITYKGLFGADGNPIADDVKEIPAGSTLQLSIDLKDAKPSDKVTIKPRTSYKHLTTGVDDSTTYSGLRLATTQRGTPITVGGVVVGKLDITAGGSAEITFNDQLNNIANGTTDVTIPVSIVGIYRENVDLDISRSTPIDGQWVLQVEAPWSSGTKKFGNRTVTFPYIEEAAHKRVLTAWFPANGVVVDEDNQVANIGQFQQRLPYGEDTKVVLKPTPAGTENATTQWSFSEDVANGAIKPRLRLWTFNDQGEHTSRNDVEDPKKIEDLGIKMESKFVDGALEVTVTGVEGTGYKPVVILEGQYLGTTTYQPNGRVGVTAEMTNLKTNAEYTNHSTAVIPRAAGIGGDGDQIVRTATAAAKIADLPADSGDGVSAPARIAGKKKQFVFTVKNTGNGRIISPQITFPDGSTKVFTGDAIEPNETKDITVEYEVPSNATSLNFGISYPLTTVEPNSFTFSVDQSVRVKDNGDGTVTVTDPEGNDVIVVTKDEFDKLKDEVEKLKNKQDVHVVEGVRNPDNSITLTLNNGDKITIPAAQKSGLEKCLNAPGGALLALLPVLGLLTAGLSQLNADPINKGIIDWQKQAGIYNEEAAKFVAQNRGALGAILGSIIGSIVLFVPGLCGDVSLAGALKESFGKGSSNPPAPEADSVPQSQPENSAPVAGDQGAGDVSGQSQDDPTGQLAADALVEPAV